MNKPKTNRSIKEIISTRNFWIVSCLLLLSIVNFVNTKNCFSIMLDEEANFPLATSTIIALACSIAFVTIPRFLKKLPNNTCLKITKIGIGICLIVICIAISLCNIFIFNMPLMMFNEWSGLLIGLITMSIMLLTMILSYITGIIE